MSEMQSLYDKDFYAWVLHTVDKLKSKKFDEVDLNHVIEEIESVGAKEKSELTSRLAILIIHLLKWQYQPELQSKSWDLTIWNQRQDLKTLLEYSPSLKSEHHIKITLEKAYKRAVTGALKETGFYNNPFPDSLPYTLEQLLDEDFYPMS